jgi:hypothetical protein
MTTEARIQLTSSELGTLWMTYMSTCSNLIMCDSLRDKTIDKNYMSGFNLFSDKRSLNTIEVGFLCEAIEDNIFGMQMMTGFACQTFTYCKGYI